MKIMRLVLGDQLNYKHSWYSNVDDKVIYLMAEMRQETDYVVHHIQKLVAFFDSMRNFSEFLEDRGHKIIYLKINDAENPQDLSKIIIKHTKHTQADKFEYQLPDEYRLDKQLESICENLEIPSEAFDTEHFYTTRIELSNFFEGKKELVMERFYRMMRKKHEVLMQNGQPTGGAWNFDKKNRKSWKGKPQVPHERGFRKDVNKLLKEIKDAGIHSMGEINASQFSWPTSREDSLSVLNYFCQNLLVHFGDFQDALHTDQKYFFHSRLSFALNSKMLSPKEVVDKVLAHYEAHKATIDISQVEGFVRQILGWREYMRGVYWKEMPSYGTSNTLGNENELPAFFWNGKTKMNCLKHCITQSLEDAYAHHIQRLMIIGNFALLIQVHPDAVDAWYLGVYIDAIEWVEITNTRGMSQFADGGIVATKPYVSSANYISKMSNYCKECAYDANKKTEEDSCPFNSLYWNFIDTKKAHFIDNPRMAMMLSLLEKKDAEEINKLKNRAKEIIQNPDKF